MYTILKMADRMEKMATRWGIMSAGKISHDFVTAVRSIEGDNHKIVAVAARRIEDAKAFATLHNIPKAYSSYDDIAKDPVIQVVYIGSINSNHFPWGKTMLEHGKHVLIEKPLCLNIENCRELFALAKQKGLFLMEAVWSRFVPSYNFIMKKLDEEAIGSVLSITCSLGYPLEQVENIRKRDLGGGALLNIGIYCLNAVAMVYAHEIPQKISAVGHLNSEGVDENLSVSLQFSGGRLATFSTSTRVALPSVLHIIGTKGSLKIPKNMFCPTEVFLRDEEYTFSLPTTVLTGNYENSSGLRYQAMEVRRCILEGLLESPGMNHSHSDYLHSVMNEICQQLGVSYSSMEKKPVL